MIGSLGMPELVIILVIVLLIFGAGKIPEIARSLGKGIKEFKKAGKEIDAIEIKKEEKIPEEEPSQEKENQSRNSS